MSRMSYGKTNFLVLCNPAIQPDGWSCDWLVNGHCFPTRLQCQQEGGGVMFWAGNMGRELQSIEQSIYFINGNAPSYVTNKYSVAWAAMDNKRETLRVSTILP